ncbi:MAG: hypothetical protein ACPG4T_21405, partial [Nannocystaceae bacterium]
AVEKHYLRTDEHVLVFTNRSGYEREVHLVLDAGRNATVEGADGIDFDSTTGQPLAIFKVPPGKSKPRKLVVKRGLRFRSSVSNIDAEALQALAETEGLAQATRQVLTQAVTQANKVAAVREKIEELDNERETVTEDLERLREHLKALGDGERGASKPLLTRLLATEDRLQKIRRDHASAEKSVSQELNRLRTQLEALAPEPNTAK